MATQAMDRPSQAYILRNRVTHVRLRPCSSTHGFKYQTVSFLLSLNALESHSLDLLRGFLFSYGGLYARLTGIRPDPYLNKSPKSIKQKLIDVLVAEGLNAEQLHDAWIMTMPSYLGWEGINPLTVYFCYNSGGEFWLVVLEVHNTFGESHVYILPLGSSEVYPAAKGYDHQWTFQRSFHVSPFNDRSGYYTVSVTRPSHGPSEINGQYDAPTPAVRVHMHTAAHHDGNTSSLPIDSHELGTLKFAAQLTPILSMPLTSLSLLRVLSIYPLVLLLTFLRITYHAWILHYTKGLDVYMRPEPLGRQVLNNNSHNVMMKVKARGVKYQSPTLLEIYARSRVRAYLARRSGELGARIVIFPLDAAAAPDIIDPGPLNDRGGFSADRVGIRTIIIRDASPEFFTHIFLSPSPAHALLLMHRVWACENEDEFLQLFADDGKNVCFQEGLYRQAVGPICARSPSLPQRFRTYALPPQLIPPSPGAPHIPPVHPLDDCSAALPTLAFICASQLLGAVERNMFVLMRARFIRGTPRWDAWLRSSGPVQVPRSNRQEAD